MVSESACANRRLIDVGHSCSDAALGHYRVGLAEEGFANHADSCALGERFDGGAESRPTGANDQNIVFVGFVIRAHSILRSWIAPEATMRMYKSERPTEKRLSQANSM